MRCFITEEMMPMQYKYQVTILIYFIKEHGLIYNFLRLIGIFKTSSIILLFKANYEQRRYKKAIRSFSFII